MRRQKVMFRAGRVSVEFLCQSWLYNSCRQRGWKSKGGVLYIKIVETKNQIYVLVVLAIYLPILQMKLPKLSEFVW